MKYTARLTYAGAVLALLALAAGCDRPGAAGGPKTAGREFSPVLDTIRLAARGAGTYDIISIDPAQGPLAGGNAASLTGSFPDATTLAEIQAAMAAYTVFFGTNAAAYDLGASPPVSATTISVTVPQGAAPGPVDVIYRENATLTDIDTLPSGYEYLAAPGFDIFSVDPPQGPLSGGNAATLSGIFPDVTTPAEIQAALAAYTVYFGSNFAAYDLGASPVMSATTINVTVPPGDALGFVDVIFRENATLNDLAALANGYEYIDDFAVIEVIPPAGPLAGGQSVRVVGRYPIAAPISSVAAAEAVYRVYFGGNPANFDPAANPVITPDSMFVITPPGAMPGFVDVLVSTVVLPSETPNSRLLVDGYEYLGPLDVVEVDPDRGWIFGFEQVTIRGTFPVTQAFSDSITAVSAANYYYVQFGNRFAQFDPFVATPVITPTEMRVLSPPAENVGFVDVSVGAFDDMGGVIEFDTLAQAYRYYGMYFLRAVPPQGPVPGGNSVRLEGVFPGLNSISSISQAEAIYSIYFDLIDPNVPPFMPDPNQQAFFDTNIPPNPVFVPSQIDTINQTYTVGFMYVTAPPAPGLIPNLVDVLIEDDQDIDLPALGINGYEYLGDQDGIQRWDNAVILPNPVGKLLAGELLVRIEGIGTIDPAGPGTIELEFVSYTQNNQFFVWEGTNIDPIPRIMDGSNLLVDGHAAVYLDAGDGEIIGDSLDPAEGGIIGIDAQEGRHCIIDTIPPRLYAPLGILRGDDFVQTDLASGDYRTIPGNMDVAVVPSPGPFPSTRHPYPLPPAPPPAPPGHASVLIDAPFDGNVLTRPGDPDNVAQVFFNVASASNGFPLENLQFDMPMIIFEDADIYTMLGRTPNPTFDTDFFTGSTARQVAGFETGLNVTLTGLTRDEAFITNPNLLVGGQFLPGPFTLPEMFGITVEFTIPAGAPPSDGSAASLSPNLAQTPTWLQARFEIGDVADPDSGVRLNPDEFYRLIPIVFRGVDRAGDYFPRGDTNLPFRKLWTADDETIEGYTAGEQPEMGPLNLWWLRLTGTRIVSDIPSSEDIRTPSFSWDNINLPDPDAFVDQNTGEGTERLFSFAIYRTIDPAAPPGPLPTRDEQRDGPYYQIAPWSAWDRPAVLTADEVATVIDSNVASLDGLVENVWFLLVVMSVDEAGNVEIWPEAQLQIDDSVVDGSSTSPSQILAVIEPGDEERNWERWFVPPLGEVIDTRVDPFYWHDGVLSGFIGQVDANERVFGDAEVIPLPPPATFSPLQGVLLERVTAQFRVTMETDDPGATIDWRILENGVELNALTDVAQDPSGSLTVTVVLPNPTDLAGFLGSRTREPTYYTFEAATNAFGATDTSPARVSFVVVDNVANFIRNREETQPIRESDVR
jgi:hypothetical protein